MISIFFGSLWGACSVYGFGYLWFGPYTLPSALPGSPLADFLSIVLVSVELLLFPAYAALFVHVGGGLAGYIATSMTIGSLVMFALLWAVPRARRLIRPRR
jgi:hypothetical protein